MQPQGTSGGANRWGLLQACAPRYGACGTALVLLIPSTRHVCRRPASTAERSSAPHRTAALRRTPKHVSHRCCPLLITAAGPLSTTGPFKRWGHEPLRYAHAWSQQAVLLLGRMLMRGKAERRPSPGTAHTLPLGRGCAAATAAVRRPSRCAGRPAATRPAAPAAAQVFVERPSGDVVLRFHRTDVVRVRPTGDVLLTTGGYLTQ